jgi:hypothetical protein
MIHQSLSRILVDQSAADLTFDPLTFCVRYAAVEHRHSRAGT